jgi:hypothetical protein
MPEGVKARSEIMALSDWILQRHALGGSASAGPGLVNEKRAAEGDRG